MPRGRRTSTLASLERQLAEVNATRHQILVDIRAAVDRLTAGATAGVRSVRESVAETLKPRRRRRVTAAGRRRLSELAKARWAKAKKAGKTRLGS